MRPPGILKRKALDLGGTLLRGPLVRAHLRSLIRATECQEKFFRALRDRLANTAVGRELRLGTYATHKEFIRSVPPHGYEFYEGYVNRIMQGEPGVLYDDATEFFLMTSGTSGFNRKIIPCNTAHRRMIERAQRRALAILISGGSGLTLASDRFAYGTRAEREDVNGIPKDYISGVLPHLVPRRLREYVVPANDTLAIRDWPAKVERIAAEARHRDVRGIFGVPAHLLHVLRDVMATWGVGCLRDVWPNLELCVYSGTSVQSFRHSLNRLAGGTLNYFGAYVSTESPLGFEVPGYEPDPARMAFSPDQVLYSFVDLNGKDKELLALDELQEGGDYLVNIGTPNGFLHYAMHDWIKVARTVPFVQFELMGRIDAVLNVATEKTSEGQLAHAVRNLQEKLDVSIAHYFVHPSEDKEGMPGYAWTLAAEAMPDASVLARELDAMLMEAAADYREARLDAGTLAPPVVRIISAAGIQKHISLRMNGAGQYKMRHAFRSAAAFRAYCAEQEVEIWD